MYMHMYMYIHVCMQRCSDRLCRRNSDSNRLRISTMAIERMQAFLSYDDIVMWDE